MIRDVAFGDVAHELANTRRMLAAAPEKHWEWHPHEKSWSLGELATHVANLVGWQISILAQPEFDLANSPPPREAAQPSALLAEYDARADTLLKALAGASDDTLAAEWTLRNGKEVLFRMPRTAALRSFGLSHMIHHRGQLGVYLRLLDAPVPGIYGPSADEASGGIG